MSLMRKMKEMSRESSSIILNHQKKSLPGFKRFKPIRKKKKIKKVKRKRLKKKKKRRKRR